MIDLPIKWMGINQVKELNRDDKGIHNDTEANILQFMSILIGVLKIGNYFQKRGVPLRTRNPWFQSQ